MNTEESSYLTKHPAGSLKEILHISFPLMISSFASLLMIFVDRCFLAKYGVNEFNASVSSGTLAWAFLGGVGMMVSMSEVFVSQYYGARDYHKIGSAVWQMIWIGFFSIIFFFFLAYKAAPIFFQNSPYAKLETEYFFYLVIFGPFYAVYAALTGFFVGRGKTRLILLLAVGINILNVILDRLLIFGAWDIIPPMGLKGAAIGTSLGTIVESAILLYLFLKKTNRVSFATSCWKIHPNILKKSFKIGFPQGFFYALEILGWTAFYLMMTKLSTEHITISGICQSTMIFFSFFFDGLSRGVAAIAGNFIGANKHSLIGKLLKSSMKLQTFFTLFTSLFFVGFPQLILYFLVPDNFGYPDSLRTSLILVLFLLFFDGIRWILSGLLTAAGDTWFLLVFGASSVWFLLLVPTYLFVFRLQKEVEVAWFIAVAYVAIISLIYYLRYKSNRWKAFCLIERE